MQAFTLLLEHLFGSDNNTTYPLFLQLQAFNLCTHALVYLYPVTVLFKVRFRRSNYDILAILYVDW